MGNYIAVGALGDAPSASPLKIALIGAAAYFGYKFGKKSSQKKGYIFAAVGAAGALFVTKDM